jgi:hypothetical protein
LLYPAKDFIFRKKFPSEICIPAFWAVFVPYIFLAATFPITFKSTALLDAAKAAR